MAGKGRPGSAAGGLLQSGSRPQRSGSKPQRSGSKENEMRLGLNMGYSGSGLRIDLPLVKEADQLGYHSVWSAEAYGSDAVTTITWVAAQTAITLDQLSGGRFLLGLGVSGPQVVEGWHGMPFGKPLQRTREYVEIVRAG